MTENRNYYKKKIVLLLCILTIVFGVFSLYQYYRGKITNPFQLLSAVLYGTIKLFLFAAPLSAEANAGIMYEFAKWMAPILTSAFIFTQISNILLHSKNVILNRLSGNHIVLFGSGKMTELLIGNFKKSKKKYRLSLISGDFLDERLKNQYERKGIACYRLDFGKCDKNEIRELFTTLKIKNAKYLFFTVESDLENFSLYAGVIERIKPARAMTAYVHSESGTVATYMEELLSEERKKEESLQKLDTVHFNERDLSIRMLLQEKLVRDSLFQSLNGLLTLSAPKNGASENREGESGSQNGATKSREGERREKDSLKEEVLSVDNMEKRIRPPHILLFGVNELSLPLFKQLANDATFSLTKKTKITVLDEDAEKKVAEILSIYGETAVEDFSKRKTPSSGLTMALDIECIELGASSKETVQKEHLENYLRKVAMCDAPDLFFLMDKDIVKNLKTLHLINLYFNQSAKIIRNVTQVDLTELLPKKGGAIRSFGDISEILTENVLIRESLDRRAKAFNESYNKAASLSGMGEGTDWNALSYVKKNSSRLSATHQVVKEEILRKVFPGKKDADIRDYCKEKLSEFRELQKGQKEHPEEFHQRFSCFLAENPLLDFLSRLEHKRWCNSYYAMGFRYGEKKDENRKTHPCLIEDWGEVIGEKFALCHPEYDLLSVFCLFQEES